MKNSFFLILGLIIIFGSFFLFLRQTPTVLNQQKIIEINDKEIAVEVAATAETRSKGLSGRGSLEEGTGMLFIFDSPAQYGFWMKDMNFAIDIVWIDEKFHIVDVDKEVSPETFPQVFYPAQEIKYVLELLAGTVDKYRIATNTVVQL